MAREGGLGRGLDSLLKPNQLSSLGHQAATGNMAASEGDQGTPSGVPQQIALERLAPSAEQPRQYFDDQALEQLADSIREQGVIQPLLVRTRGDGFEIIAGERRWRAARMAQVPTVPIIIRDDLDEKTILAVALVENLQREDLNAMEEAEALHKLVTTYGLTHEDAARAVGRSRSAITNALRLLELDRTVQDHVRQGRLKMGHVRPLLSLPDEKQRQLAEHVLEKKLSSRQVEQEAARLSSPKPSSASESKTAQQVHHIQKIVRQKTGLDVSIKVRINGSGQIVIPFADEAILSALVERWFKVNEGEKS